MSNVDAEPLGYRCICGHTRLEHEHGGKLCQVYTRPGVVCMCSVFAASVVPLQAPDEPIQEDDTMTIHAVPRDDTDQSKPPEGLLANGKAEDGHAGADDGEDDAKAPSVLEQVEALEKRRSTALKIIDAEEAKLLNGLNSDIEVARLKLSQLEGTRDVIVARQAGKSPKPSLAKTKPEERAKKAAATRKANKTRTSAEPTFKAQLIEWVGENQWSLLDDMAKAFPKTKRSFISTTLYNAKKAGELKSKGSRRSMKWSKT